MQTSSDNRFTMNARQPVRKVASLILAVTLLLWVEAGVAIVPVSAGSVQCRALMQHMHPATAAGMHAMASGCCPRHASLKPTAAALPPAQRPDCCVLSNPPARPVAFLTARGAPIELRTQVSAGPVPVTSPPEAAVWLDESPPFTRLVFEMKTDLRI
jgi:hypothetical protein